MKDPTLAITVGLLVILKDPNNRKQVSENPLLFSNALLIVELVQHSDKQKCNELKYPIPNAITGLVIFLRRLNHRSLMKARQNILQNLILGITVRVLVVQRHPIHRYVETILAMLLGKLHFIIFAIIVIH